MTCVTSRVSLPHCHSLWSKALFPNSPVRLREWSSVSRWLVLLFCSLFHLRWQVLGQQAHEGLVIDRLDDMVIEAGLMRLAPVLFLTPAGQGHHHHVFPSRLFPNAATSIIAI